MQQIKLQSDRRKNQSVILLHTGEVLFNENGTADVELTGEQLAEVLSLYSDLSVYTEPATGGDIGETETGDLGKSAEDDKNDIGETETEDIDVLAGYSAKELKELAAASELPENEWAKLNKQELKAYLAEKLKQ